MHLHTQHAQTLCNAKASYKRYGHQVNPGTLLFYVNVRQRQLHRASDLYRVVMNINNYRKRNDRLQSLVRTASVLSLPLVWAKSDFRAAEAIFNPL